MVIIWLLAYMNKLLNTDKIVIILVMLLAIFVRFYGLGKSPISMNFDEAALGYNAYSLGTNGRDEYGRLLPLSLRSFNDYKPALYAYLSIPFVKLFGLSEVSTRAVSAVAGVISVLVLLSLLKLFIKDKMTLYLVWLFLSLEPWRIHFSRVALETNLSACLFLLGSYNLLLINKSEKINKQYIKILLAVLFLGLSVYSYHSARVSSLVLLMLWWIDPIGWLKNKKWLVFGVKKLRKERIWIGLVAILVILLLPIFLVDDVGLVMTRLRIENLLTRYFPYTPKELILTENVWLNWRNHPLYYLIGQILGRFTAYLSPINLTVRLFDWVEHSVQYIPGFVIFGWLSASLVLVGFVTVMQKLKTEFSYRVLIYWMVAGIMPAAATWNWFHSLRSLNIYPVLEVFAALGYLKVFEYMSKKIKKSLVYSAFFLVFAVTASYTINNEIVYGAYVNNGEFQSGGFKQGVKTIMEISKDYDKIIVDSPHAQSYIFFLFYSSYDPVKLQSYSNLRPKPDKEGDQNFNFDKFEFRKIYWPDDRNLENTIFWADPTISEKDVLDSGYKLIRVKKDVEDYDGATIVYR